MRGVAEILFVLLLASCGGSPSHVGSNALLCGAVTCSADQICVQPCGGGPAAGTPICTTIPTACGTAPACSCFSADPCSPCGTCSQVQDGHLTCACLCL